MANAPRPLKVYDEGVLTHQGNEIDFVGAGVSVSSLSGKAVVNISSGGVSDHGALSGLEDDDHSQYLNTSRANTWLATKSTSDLAEGTNLYYTAARFNSAFSAKSTSDLSEGSNLYYTSARFDTAFAAKSTTDLAEGTNLYYTATRFNSAFSAKSTSDLAEGSNLYFTNSRAQSAMSGLYEVPLTFSTGLTRSINTITVNTTQNIAKLSNLTSNGFVKTSGSDGTLSVDTNTYLTANQTISLSGDVSGSGATSITTTLGNNVVTYAKFQQVAASSLIGNPTGSLANAQAIALDGNMVFSGSTLYMLNSAKNKNAARVATTASLTATYSNGTGGVGATLTNSGTLAAISIDSVSLNLNDRVVVKNQSSQEQNGVYYVSTVGSGVVAWVLTRATDFDGSTIGPIPYGAQVQVVEGTTNAGVIYIMSQSSAITVGTTAITFLGNAAVSGGSISGSGISGRVTYWNGTTSLTSASGFTFDGTHLTVTGSYLVGGTTAVQLGRTLSSSNNSDVIVGIGNTVTGTHEGGTVFGRSCSASGQRGLVAGTSCTQSSGGSGYIVAGYAASFSGSNGGSIGVNISNTQTNLLALGMATANRVNIYSSGALMVNGGNESSIGAFFVRSLSAGTSVAVIRAAASQTSNLLIFQDSSANTLSAFDSGGRLGIGGGTYSTSYAIDVNYSTGDALVRLKAATAVNSAYIAIDSGSTGNPSIYFQRGGSSKWRILTNNSSHFELYNFAASATALTVDTTTSVITTNGGITFADATNMAVGSTTGTKIGTATTQKLSVWNATPIVQPTTGIAAATFVANTSSTVDDSATWDGYTIGQVVKALRNFGLLA